MHRQLGSIVSELESAERRLAALRSSLSRDGWVQRPAPGRWSPAQCVAHLNLTSEALLPLLGRALTRAGTREQADSPYRMDLAGWVLAKAIAPASPLRTRTPHAFEPATAASPDALVHEFGVLQAQLIACVRAADGRAIDGVRLESPFDGRLRYNLYSAMTLVPRHQHRHLLQAERAACIVGLELSVQTV